MDIVVYLVGLNLFLTLIMVVILCMKLSHCGCCSQKYENDSFENIGKNEVKEETDKNPPEQKMTIETEIL